MINVKKSHKNKILYLKNLKNTQPLTQSQIPTIPPPLTQGFAQTLNYCNTKNAKKQIITNR